MTKKVIDFNRLPKQKYQMPSMKVVLLQHHYHILAGSEEPKTLRGASNDWKELE